MSDIERLKEENERLKQELEAVRNLLPGQSCSIGSGHGGAIHGSPLEYKDICRYARHLLVPQIGISGQQKLRDAAVLVVGAGGLGAPILMYLTGSGVGRIGVVDHDIVDVSNIHRQVIHTEETVGLPKVRSAIERCTAINSRVKFDVYRDRFTAENGLDLVAKYDVVIDASDNVSTRYLVNDACVLCNKPLVSGSALQLEGQLTVYNYDGGPCYRCVHPHPPPRAAVMNCDEGGVLGAVPGFIGVAQAIEAIKIIIGGGKTLSGRLFTFNAWTFSTRVARLRGRNSECTVCGESPQVTDLRDIYEGNAVTCAATAQFPEIPTPHNISATEYSRRIEAGELTADNHIVVDVRSAVQYNVQHLPNAINVPVDRIASAIPELQSSGKTLVVYCRRGNASRKATKAVLDAGVTDVYNMVGGVTAWHAEVDAQFPVL